MVHTTVPRSARRSWSAGDLLVINTSGTMNAALPRHARRRHAAGAAPLHAPAGGPLDRRAAPAGRGARRSRSTTAGPGETLALPGGGDGHAARRPTSTIAGARGSGDAVRTALDRHAAPARAAARLPGAHGFPIRYGYVHRAGPPPTIRRSMPPRRAAPRCPRRAAPSRRS